MKSHKIVCSSFGSFVWQLQLFLCPATFSLQIPSRHGNVAWDMKRIIAGINFHFPLWHCLGRTQSKSVYITLYIFLYLIFIISFNLYHIISYHIISYHINLSYLSIISKSKSIPSHPRHTTMQFHYFIMYTFPHLNFSIDNWQLPLDVGCRQFGGSRVCCDLGESSTDTNLQFQPMLLLDDDVKVWIDFDSWAIANFCLF